MPSTAAIEPVYENSKLNLLACLALYQHKQDQAIGVTWVSARVRTLLWHYARLQREQLSGLMTAAYLGQTIQEKANAIKKIEKVIIDAENKRELLRQAIELEIEIDIAKEMLDQFMEQPSLV